MHECPYPSPANVYIVAKGECGEGQIPERVCTTLDDARQWVLDHYRAGAYTQGGGKWMATWNQVDEVWIYRMKVCGE